MTIPWEIIKRNTIVDKEKFEYTIELLSNKEVHNIIEIGVYKGGFGLFLNSLFPVANLFLCDTFEGIPFSSVQDNHHKAKDFDDVSYDNVEGLFKNKKNVKLVKGIFPDSTTAEISNTMFDVVHLDVDVYKSYKDCLEFFSTRLSADGIILLDDYAAPTCKGAAVAVDEFVETHSNFLLDTTTHPYLRKIT
jgi:O-methyltransferase